MSHAPVFYVPLERPPAGMPRNDDVVDRWIIQVDQQCRRIGNEAATVRDIFAALVKILQAESGRFWLHSGGHATLVVQTGDEANLERYESIDSRHRPDSDRSNAGLAVRWEPPAASITAAVDQAGDDHQRLSCYRQIDRAGGIEISISFGQRLDERSRQQVVEVIAATLDLITPVCLRHCLHEQTSPGAVGSTDRQWLELALSGGSLSSVLAEIAKRLADAMGQDRVAILKVDSGRCQILAASTLANPDRRARQVRLLEETALQSCLAGVQSESFSKAGDSAAVWLRAYWDESSAISLRIDRLETMVGDRETEIVLVSERFVPRPDPGTDGPMDSLLTTAGTAIAIARARLDRTWAGQLAPGDRHLRRPARRWVALGVISLLCALAWMPVELRVQATGRVIPAVRQRLFSPVDGVVAHVYVGHGQRVTRAEPLAELQSAELDLAKQQVLGEMATVKVRLESVLAARTRATSAGGRAGASGQDWESLAGGDLAAHEAMLKSQLTGLQEQYRLIEHQMAELTLTSPLDGIAMRWDMEQSLHHRPVTTGQFLLEVVAVEGPWVVELEVPDAEIGYVQRAFSQAQADCTFRFRHEPTIRYRGQVGTVDAAAVRDAQGQSVVRVVVPIQSPETLGASETFQRPSIVNASVLATIHCGKRPLVIVHSRGLIRWAQSHLGL